MNKLNGQLNIIYVSRTCSKERFSKLENYVFSCAAQKYNLLIADGFINNDVAVTMLSNPPVFNKKIICTCDSEISNGITFKYCGFINLPVLRNICSFFSSFFRVLFSKGKRDYVVCDMLDLSSSLGAVAACRLKRIPTLGIITDVFAYSNKAKKYNFAERLYLSLLSKPSAFLFLTEQMNSLLNKKDKPYIVIEGQVDVNSSEYNLHIANNDEKICMFAGNLARLNGLEYLIQGFLDANISDCYLDIYGNGEMREQLNEISRLHPSVRYIGSKPNQEVLKAEREATLLINPRKSNQGFTKYSFPSKNMEYMSSGTPLLTTKLEGIPKDHFPYIYLLENESAEGVKKSLTEIFSKTPEELKAFGERAKNFVLTEKNNSVQAKKIIDFMQEHFKR